MISKRQTKKTKVLSMILITGMMLSACGSVHGRQPTIEGGDLVKSGEYSDRRYVQASVDRLQEKYHRHFDNGLYFEDLQAAKETLNREYNRHLQQQMDRVFTDPYILRTEVEFVNSEVKAYAEGKKTFEEILREPGNNIMSVKGKFYGFRPTYQNIKYSKEAYPEYDLLENMSREYVENGLDYLEIWVNEYPQQILTEYPMEKIRQQENIDRYLANNAKKIITGYIGNTYYYLDKRMPIARLKAGAPGRAYEEKEAAVDAKQLTPDDESVEYIIHSNLENLKKKYNMDFFSMTKGWYAPIQYPELYFDSTHYKKIILWGENEDYFLSTYYQYLLGEKIKGILEEEGLSDSIVYLVETEPVGDYMDAHSTCKAFYPFGKEGYTQEHFLFEGYEGKVHINFLVLQTPEKNIDPAKIKTVRNKIDAIAGVSHNSGCPSNIGVKIMQVQYYKVDEYEKKVVVDLFRKHPITERIRRPETTLSEVYSEKYDVRAETEGFHYLDIFGEKLDREW